MIGTGLLWFWLVRFQRTVLLWLLTVWLLAAFAATNTATAAAGLSWIFFDVIRGRKPSVLGFCIGAVASMVAITPAAGYVGVPQSSFIGFIAAIVSNIVVHYQNKSSIDDTLDVFPCHGVGGMVGMFLTGVFASTLINPAAGMTAGLTVTFSLFYKQVLGLLLVVAYSFVVSWLIFKVINLIHPLRVN